MTDSKDTSLPWRHPMPDLTLLDPVLVAQLHQTNAIPFLFGNHFVDPNTSPVAYHTNLTNYFGLGSPTASLPEPKSGLRTIAPLPPRPTLHMSPALSQKRVAGPERPEDVLKRKKNTDAARRSRLKKLQRMEALTMRVGMLQKESLTLTTRAAVLESEKANLTTRSSSLQERIQTLEVQLAAAHKALGNQKKKASL